MNKKGIRYNTIWIIALILISIVLSNLFTIFRPVLDSFFEENHIENHIAGQMYDYAYTSEDSEGIVKNGKSNLDIDYLTFFTIRSEIENYLETEEYHLQFPNDLVFKNPYNGFYYIVKKDEYEVREVKVETETYDTEKYYDYYYDEKRDRYIYVKEILKDYTKITGENYSKPIIVEKKVTNDKNVKDTNFKSLESVANSTKLPVIYVKKTNGMLGRFGNDDIKFEVRNAENITEIEKEIINFLKNRYEKSNLNEGGEYYGETSPKKFITSYESVFIINPPTQLTQNIINERENLYKILSNGIVFTSIVALFFLFMASITQYRKSREVRFYRILESIPIEIFSLLLILPGITGSYGLYYVFENISNTVMVKNNLIISVIYSIMMFAMILLIYYVIHGLKSFYNDGTKSYVVQNSIIFRVTRLLFRGVSGFITKLYRVIIGNNITNKRLRIIIFIILALLGYFFGRWHPFIVITWTLLLLLAYYIFNKFLEDVKNIEDATYEINKGNFNVNLNEDNSYFGNISRNLNNINETLTMAMDKELKSERMKTELISNVSHDLKTPLTAIINYSDLASKENSTQEDIKKYVEIINEKSIKLKSLIENLFEVSKVTSNNVKLNKVNIDINLMLKQMIGEWDEEFSMKGLDVVFNSNKENIIVELDGEQTSRIFDNLFSNINKYALENTRVYIDLIQDEETKLTMKNVSKYGLNISPDELKERFTRGDESRNTEGSGLGLAIASSLTELQGGTFEIDIDGDLFKITIVF